MAKYMYMCAPWWSYFSVTLGQYLYHKMGQMTMFLINICNCLDVKRDGRMGSGKRNQRKETERGDDAAQVASDHLQTLEF